MNFRQYFVCLLFSVMLIIPAPSIASLREYAIKSGFIYNFARYSEGQWFDSSVMKSYNICSFNAQFVQTAKKTLNNRHIKNVPVSVLLITSQEDNTDHCHTLFISKEDTQKWGYLSKYQSRKHIMLVGEFENFILTGGHINFFTAGGKIRFEVNPDKLKQSGIQMSSKVLRLGRTNKAGQ